MKPALFVDRDGVIIRDIHLMTRAQDVEVLAGAADAIAMAQSAGYAIVVVTNQSVVARGLCSEADVADVHDHLDRLLVQAGCQPLDGYYVCPHHPNADVAAYRADCECRKPKPGMWTLAGRDLDLDLSSSVTIGDRPTDVLAGHRAGTKTVLVGAGDAPLLAGISEDELVDPDLKARDLLDAVQSVLGSAAS